MRAPFAVAALVALLSVACYSEAPVWGEPSDLEGGAGQPEAGVLDHRDVSAPLPDSAIDSGPPVTAPPIGPTTLTPGPAACARGQSPQALLLTEDATLLSFDPPSLSTRVLGKLGCPSSPTPAAFAVTSSGTAFVLGRDQVIYQVDLASLSCTKSAYAPGQLGFAPSGMTAGAGPAADRMYYVGGSGQPEFAVSDLTSFDLFEIGALGSSGTPALIDAKVDAFDRMYALGIDGTLEQLDPTSGEVLGEDHTGFQGTTTGSAMLVWGTELYLFQGGTGNVSRYDLASKTSTPVGAISMALVGAGSTPCVASSAVSEDAGLDAAVDGGSGQDDNPFIAGQVWIGTYACPNGVTPAALAVESVSGDAIQARMDILVGMPVSAASYAVTGTYDPSTREVDFAPGRWFESPPADFSAVGLDGFASVAGDELSGTVSASGCGAFSMTR
jgi:hypothetical protein